MAETKRVEIEVDNLDMTLLGNKILCKVDVITGMGKNGLYTGDKVWDAVGGLCTRFGEVIKTPKELTFRKSGSESGMEWQTTMEAKTGDIAYWGIMEGTNCPVIKYGDEVFFLVDYGEIRLIKRGDEIIPVNGFILLEEVVESVKTNLITPDSAKKTNKRKGIVKYIGKRNECYYPESKMCDPVGLKVGDTVFFRREILTVLEDDRYFSICKGLNYVQGRWCIAKLN